MKVGQVRRAETALNQMRVEGIGTPWTLAPCRSHPGVCVSIRFHDWTGDDGVVRLFVALTPPEEVVRELLDATAGLWEVAPELQWTRPEQWHLTLAFLGEVGNDIVDELTHRLGRAAARHPPLSLSFSGGGRFGHQVLWTDVRGDRDGLRRLADSAQAAARRSRLPVEQRPYRPHLTLARAKAGSDLRPLVEQLAPWEGSPWRATRLHLVRSRLGAAPGGFALHEPIAGWPLKGVMRVDQE
jgi:RNA 2',3'-cyclic 3'-phosphodiesterase